MSPLGARASRPLCRHKRENAGETPVLPGERDHRQSPAAVCTTASAATAAVSARKMRGPSAIRDVRGRRRSAARSSSPNPPSGPINTASSALLACAAAKSARNAATGSPHGASSSQKARWHEGPSAGLGVAHDHGMKPGNAHFDRLLHHVVKPGALEGGKQIMQVAGLRLRPGLGLNQKDGISLGPPGETRLPFAVCPIEHEHRVARRHAQHAREVVDLGGVQRDREAGAERRRNKQPGTAKIVARHVP